MSIVVLVSAKSTEYMSHLYELHLLFHVLNWINFLQNRFFSVLLLYFKTNETKNH